MEPHENSTFSSHIPQYPRQPPSDKALTELPSATNNARPASLIAPPGSMSRKHKDSSLPEPAAKRQTTADRIGETSRIMGPPQTKPTSSSFKGKTLQGLSSRNPSFSSSVSSRTPSMSTRNTSGSSFSSSVGAGTRPPSHSISRPQTSLGNSRSRVLPGSSRPATSLDSHDVEEEPSVPGNRKGMAPVSLSHLSKVRRQPSSAMRLKKQGSYDSHMSYNSDWSSSLATGASNNTLRGSYRDLSLTRAMNGLSLAPQSPLSELPNAIDVENDAPKTPKTLNSKLPVPVTPVPSTATSTPTQKPRKKSPEKSPTKKASFLTRDSNTQAWDTKGRLEDMEGNYRQLQQSFTEIARKEGDMQETIGFYKARLNELEAIRTQLTEANSVLRTDVETTKLKLSTVETALRDAQRNYDIDIDDLKRQHRNELESIRQDGRRAMERVVDEQKDELRDVKRRLEDQVEQERSLRIRELSQMSTQGALEKQHGQIELENKDREIRTIKGELDEVKADLEREKTLNKDLRQNLATQSSNQVTLESSMKALKSKIEYLESDSKSQSQAFGNLQQELQDAINAAKEAKAKLLTEETLRRKLHNQVQELKGNIRVFCRVRPSLDSDSDAARISYPDNGTDAKEIHVQGPEEKSSLGTITTKAHPFSFDRVFGPGSKNAEVFEEISQLVQSALDGYNVCIFCYGQTGSGKTYTMSSEDGMIPLAVRQIYGTAQNLEEKGWQYRMEGSFVEVYNENLNDLLGKAEEFDKKKHEIRHDIQKCKTTITEVTTVPLDSPDTVSSILTKAASNRSVAATKANERSSRSHSVFILKLCGENRTTGEKSEGTLNLVDLAGSERLSHSGATGERLKETQNINKSLSCLGDVIGALGQGKENGHVPYRNSKLTYLLQFSLGGNSKTLMFVMVSPLQAHLSETLTSLKFATKVHNTHIGSAKRQVKV